MSAASLILVAVKASLALMVLGVGLHSTPSDTTYLLRHRALLARSIVSMNVIMPLLALWLAITFDLLPAVKVALIALAMSPVPPFLPNKAMKAGGDGSYTVGLLFVASLLSTVLVPATVWLLGALFHVPFQISSAVVAKVVGESVLVPLVVGILIRRLAPSTAARVAKPVTIVATILLVAGLIPVLVTSWPAFRSLIGNGTLIAIVAMTCAGLAIGHVLGGPEREDRTVLALATAARHPAVAIAIVASTIPAAKLVTAVVLLDLLVGAVVSTPYVAWSKRATREARSMTPVNRHLVQ